MSSTETNPPAPAAPTDPVELLRSRSYLVLLAFGGVVGVGVAVVAYFFLKAVSEAQKYIFGDAPGRARVRDTSPPGGRFPGSRSPACWSP